MPVSYDEISSFTGLAKEAKMAENLLENVRERIRQSQKIIGFDDGMLAELLGFNAELIFDLIVVVDEEIISLEAMRVQHRTPQVDWIFKGGCRYDKSVTLTGMKSHAAEMSIKTWLKDLPYGGAKGGIVIDPLEFSQERLRVITQRHVDKLVEFRAIGSKKDVPAPDAGTNDLVMLWMQEHYSRKVVAGEVNDPNPGAVVTGKPFSRKPDTSGCPGRREATGLGMFFALDEYVKQGAVLLPGRPRVAIQGFGNVGMHFAYFLNEFNYADVVAVVDRFGGVYNGNGLNIGELTKHALSNREKTVRGFAGGESIDPKCFAELSCDIIAPCALEEVFTEKNAHQVAASVIIEGANGPTTPEADKIFRNRGITVLPDVDVNGGGVVVSFFEHGRNTNSTDPRIPNGGRKEVINSLEIFMRRSVREVLETQNKYKEHEPTLRLAAYARAIEKVVPLFKMRRFANVRKEIELLEGDINSHPWPK